MRERKIMSNLEKHAKRELTAAGFKDDAVYDGMLFDAVMELIQKFAAQGHSGMSAGITINLFKTLASFEPIGPLKGDDSEWVEVSDGVFQNNRCSRVFKQDGQAYDIDGKVFREPDGSCFTSKESRVNVSFPYTPKTEYVDVPKQDA